MPVKYEVWFGEKIKYDVWFGGKNKYEVWFGPKIKYEVWFDLKNLITMFVKYDGKNLSMKYDFAK